jgi:hypothetical protein
MPACQREDEHDSDALGCEDHASGQRDHAEDTQTDPDLNP